jgi:hypothetical protein
MKRILEFDDFVSNLSLSEVEQAEIKDFIHKYEKYMNFHDAGQFDDSIESITNDVMTHFNFPASKKEDVQNYIQSLQTLSDGISVIMSPGPEIIYRTNPDMTQTIVY